MKKKKITAEFLKSIGLGESKSERISDLIEFFDDKYLIDLNFNSKVIFETLLDLAQVKNFLLIFRLLTVFPILVDLI